MLQGDIHTAEPSVPPSILMGGLIRQTPIVQPLAGFHRPMQVVWLGQVRNIGRNGQRRPQVEVVLRPAIDPRAPTLRRLVPAAFVRALRLGDVWHGPNLVGQSTSQIIQLNELKISADPAKVQPVGKPLAGSGREYPLDFNFFSDHMGHTGSYALREELSGGRSLVVPCWELLRFYFSASGALVSRLLSGPLLAKALYVSARHDPKRDVHWVDLARGMHWTGAVTIARIALDPRAASAARWISNSGTAAITNGVPYYPKTNFPFVGTTDLTVQGRWLGTEKQVLFVERIVSCTHPFPFRTLHYSVQDRPVRVLHRPWQSFIASNSEGGRVEIREGAREPASNGAVIHLPEHTDIAFPDLAQKLMRRVRPRIDLWHGTPPSANSGGAVLTDGSEASTEGFPEVELASQGENRNDETVQPAAADVLFNAISILKSEGLTLQLRSLTGAPGAAILAPVGDIVSAAGVLGQAFECIGIRRPGRGGSLAYCLFRTGGPALAIDTHILILRPNRSSATYAVLQQALEILESGRSGVMGVYTAPESVAVNPISVARLIRRVLG